MIIENPDAFKSWLTSILEPLCDADPAALAKYVYALVKKDKPLGELRDGMLDQLDVFLQHETKPFVDMLFKSLETQEYLSHVCADPQPDEKQPSPPRDNDNDNDNSTDEPPPHVANGKPPAERVEPPRSPPRHRVVVCRNNNKQQQLQQQQQPPPQTQQPPNKPRHHPHEHTLVKAALPLTELLEEPVDQPPRRRDRREMGVTGDRRRRRSRSWERRAQGGGAGGGGGGGAARRRPHDHDRNYDRRRPISRSPSPRGRYRNRSPPAADRPPTRSRSRSPVGGRERDRLRERIRSAERDRASRDREHRDRAERAAGGAGGAGGEERDRSLSPLAPPPHADVFNKRRCRDFDEKGYCMRGDLCQWDHGADPVVLEDAALTRVLLPPHAHAPHPHPHPHPAHPPVPEYNPLTPDIWSGAGPFPPYPHPHLHPPHPPRELIPIPRVRHELGAPLMPLPPRLPPPKNFDYNRLGPVRPPPLPAGAANCSLEVKKVPRGLNDITHLNNHFSRFGKIVNIQVCYNGDPEGALITFSSPAEANVAYKSTEAVLNNRFIKVFWHNPEGKQDGAAGNAQASKPAERSSNQHPLSHNKVLVNRVQPAHAVDAARKEMHINKLAAEAAAELTKEAKKENTAVVVKPAGAVATGGTGGKAVIEMHKRAQALLETQLHQQLLLIQKLESGAVSGAARAALLEAISSAQEGIEKLRAELLAYNRALRHATAQDEAASRLSRLQLAQKKPKTREEAQKEILDAELDMFTKQQEGQDVTELAKKVAELRRQMAGQFPPHPAVRRPHARGGRFGSTRLVRNGPNATPKVFNNQVVDHRPRTLLVSGFEPDEVDAVVTHFAQFGEITGKETDLSVPTVRVQYSARAHAEQAAARARHFNDRTLTITWVTNSKPLQAVAGVAAGAVAGATAGVTAGAGAGAGASTPQPHTQQNGDTENKEMETASSSDLLRFEEEEEDDQEDRSWRR